MDIFRSLIDRRNAENGVEKREMREKNEFEKIIDRLDDMKFELGKIAEIELNPFLIFKYMFPTESSRSIG